MISEEDRQELMSIISRAQEILGKSNPPFAPGDKVVSYHRGKKYDRVYTVKSVKKDQGSWYVVLTEFPDAKPARNFTLKGSK